MRIAIITFYFGKLPNFFHLWLLSVGYNSDIDFYFFTDNIDKYDYPDNVYKVKTTFSEIKERLQRYIDIEITLEHPYKICDYRPAFGLAFQDYLLGYDFWGQCDIDVIFGNIRKFVTNKILNSYDKCFDRGYFTLYRNNKKMRELFLWKHNYPFYRYDEVFRTNYVCHFDECAINCIADKMGVKSYNEISYADIDYNSNNFKLNFIQDAFKDQIWKWKKGKLFRLYVAEDNTVKSQEMLLIHIQKRDMVCELSDKMNHSFLIVPNRFIDDRILRPEEIVVYNESKFYSKKYTIRIKEWVKKMKQGAFRQRFLRCRKLFKSKFMNNKEI